MSNSSSSSEGTQDTEGSQSTMDDVDIEMVNQKDDPKLKCKMCLKVLNKHNKNEILIQCGTCNGNGKNLLPRDDFLRSLIGTFRCTLRCTLHFQFIRPA